MARRARKLDAESPEETARRLALGETLRKVRTRRGLSIDRFAKKSGISRAMISQIELGISSPSVNVLLKITRALDIPFNALIGSPSRSTTTVVRAANGAPRRALFPTALERQVEFHELTVEHLESFEPRAAGTTVNVVALGSVEVVVADEAHQLEPGDSMIFNADVIHAYRNAGANAAVLYIVTVHPDP